MGSISVDSSRAEDLEGLAMVAHDIVCQVEGKSLSAQADDLELHDPIRNKSLSVRVSYPLSDGYFPVIIFSHGAGGSKDTYGYLAKFWSARGYVVIQPSHYDSISVLREQRPRRSFLQLMKGMPNDPSGWSDRTGDVSFLIDSLGPLQCLLPGIAGKIDASAIGVGGHSYGAFTAQLIAGVRPPLPFPSAGSENQLADSRVKAILAISAQGVRSGSSAFGFDDIESFAALSLPALYVTGDRDVSIWNDVKHRLQGFSGAAPGDKFAVVLDGANHMTFVGEVMQSTKTSFTELIYDRVQGSMPAAYGDAEQHWHDVEVATTIFWDAYLKTEFDAREFLVSDGLSRFIASRGKAQVR